MVFSSLGFLFIFLPIALILYFIAPKRAKNATLLALSLIFYAWGEPLYILLMILTAAIDFGSGLLMDRNKNGARSVILVFTVIINLLFLGFFKYYPPLTEALSFLPHVGVSLPVGISFYTFQALSYVIDVYRGEVAAQRNIVDFGLYIALFPQLVAGPIVKYSDIEAQLGSRTTSLADAVSGATVFCVGLAKKVLLGNTAGAAFNYVVCLASGERSALMAWIGLACYSFQIYFDFSGYSDMAVGLGRIFGFSFPQNFDYPYTSIGATDFWRRWHISLSGWFRDYLYIPLGGNRRGMARTYLNLFTVWTLTGLWHGASLNFLLWGVYWFVLIAADKAFAGKWLAAAPRVLSHVLTLVSIAFGWLIFAFDGSTAELTSSAGMAYFLDLFGRSGFARLGDIYGALRLLPLIAVSSIGSTSIPNDVFYRLYTKLPVRYAEAMAGALTLAAFLLSTVFITASDFNPFLYFRF